MKYKNYKLANIKCNVMTIPALSKAFHQAVDVATEKTVPLCSRVTLITEIIECAVKDEWLNFDVLEV